MKIRRPFIRRHLLTVDLRALTPEHRKMLRVALNACDAPLYKIRRATGRRVPVTVRDLSRDQTVAAVSTGAATLSHEDPSSRRAAMGLYWLPTPAHPAGRIELHHATMGNPDLAREIMLAELAHAYDLTAMDDAQRQAVFVAVHDGDSTPHQGHGWWEENGSRDYWSLLGETYMGLFVRAFAPTLPRPLEARQPWAHKVTDQHAAAVRRIILGP